MAKWTLDLSAYAKKKGVEFKEVRKAYAFALYSSIVQKTPKDTGRAQGNWNVSVGTVDSTVDPSKTTPQYKSPKQFPEPNGDDPIYISNNLPYITKLEYGGYQDPVQKGTWNPKTKQYEVRSEGGFSKRAPEGMVGLTLANNDAIFDAACRSVE